MPLRTLGIVVMAMLLALFVAVNWAAFMTPTTLSMIIGTVQAPLGLVMLVITGFVAALFVAYALWLQGSVLMETRRMTRELASQRQLADQAEASRFTELRTLIEKRLDAIDRPRYRMQAANSLAAPGKRDVECLAGELLRQLGVGELVAARIERCLELFLGGVYARARGRPFGRGQLAQRLEQFGKAPGLSGVARLRVLERGRVGARREFGERCSDDGLELVHFL